MYRRQETCVPYTDKPPGYIQVNSGYDYQQLEARVKELERKMEIVTQILEALQERQLSPVE